MKHAGGMEGKPRTTYGGDGHLRELFESFRDGNGGI
jgi:hypothetical protein